ncbi:MAG: outer membrane beta-barrel protein [bacterium]|nr:outer membrane beta-barrel protein [bacterium]
MLLGLAIAAALGTAAPPTPSPTPSPVPAFSVDGAFALASTHTSGINAAGALDTPTGSDLADRSDLSDALLVLSKNTGTLRASVTVGAYSFPTVGLALDPTTQPGANSSLFGFVPLVTLAYVPNAHLTISAGKQATLLGQESVFTYQNWNVERGLGFALEPTMSRGVRVAYTQRRFTGDLEINDGYYSGNAGRAIEGSIGWAPSANTDLQLAFIAPSRDTPGNATTAVANKAEVDAMLTRQIGKLALAPYVLFVHSPASARLGYTRGEDAAAVAILAKYAFDPTYALAARYESAADGSVASDASPNADLLGFGAGSRASTWTITPSYAPGPLFARAEYDLAHVRGFSPGLAFGAQGTSSTQRRFLVELGVQF